MNKYNFWSSLPIRAKVTSVLLPALFLIFIIVAISYSTLKKETLKNSRHLILLIINTKTTELNSFLIRQSQKFNDWTKEDIYGLAIEFETTKELGSQLGDMLAAAPGFSMLILTDASGKVLTNSVSESKSINSETLNGNFAIEIIKEVSKTSTSVNLLKSNLYNMIDKSTSETFIYSFPANNSSGELNGYLLAFIDWSRLQEQTNQIASSLIDKGLSDAQVAIIDLTNEKALSNSVTEQVGKKLNINSELKSWLSNSDDGMMDKFSLESGKNFVTFARLTDTGDLQTGELSNIRNSHYYVTSFIPEDNIMSKVTKLLWINLSIGLIGMAVLTGLTLLIASKISNPIGKITKIAQDIAHGDLNKDVDVNQGDEIGKLADAFREMNEILKSKAQVARKIAVGELNVNLNSISNVDELGKAMMTMKDSINALINDVDSLSKASVEGDLDYRVNASKHGGEFGKIIGGINNILNTVVTPVNESIETLEKVAARDLSVRMKGNYKGDHDKIKESLNKTIENLDQALLQVTNSTRQVNSASDQIATGSQALAQTASEQASSLEEVSSSLKEMRSTTKQNAANTKEAKAISGEAHNKTAKGMDSMNRLSSVINKIKESSDETAKIIKTIDDIAFQTNLLALNAAVEAARAGEAGKGFAVVAEEVRNLAMRSAEAAKDTSNLIEESVKNAEDGVSVNDEVYKNLEEINTNVKKVNDVMDEIAAATEHQTQGIEQINTAIDQLNQLTQQNAANSEESASIAQELSSQSSDMTNLVNGFNLTNSSVKEKFSEGIPSAKKPKVAHQKKQEKQKVIKELVRHNNQSEPDPKSVIPFDEFDLDDNILKEF